MIDWSENERGVLGTFMVTPSILKTALEKFIANRAEHHRAMCTAHMATVPREPELAADHAARAAELDEFWPMLTDQVLAAEPLPQNAQGANPVSVEG